MATQILVKTPLLENGTDPIFDEEGRMRYTESILSDNGTRSGAKAILEERNTKLPKHMQVIITNYVEPAPKKDKSTV